MASIGEKIRQIPKVELHRHLEGCVRTPTIIKIARRHGLKLPTFDAVELDKMLKLHSPMNSLAEVLRMFEIAQSAFVSYATVEEITRQALESAYGNENIKLMEIRYSPEFMLRGKALDWQKTLELIHDTLVSFEKTHLFLGGIIIIASRCYGTDSVSKTADFAIKNSRLIVGFDIADAETGYPPSLYENTAKKLHNAGIPLTVHSGEESSFEYVLQTIRLLAPRRIGHGVKAADDGSGKTLRLIKEKNITIETNPWSNYLTHAVDSLETHPLKNFIRDRISVSISADEPEVLDTDLNREYLLAVEKIGLSLEDIAYTNICALAASFLPWEKKQEASKFLKLPRPPGV